MNHKMNGLLVWFCLDLVEVPSTGLSQCDPPSGVVPQVRVSRYALGGGDINIINRASRGHQVFKNASPPVVWIGDDVYERVGCKGRHDEDVGDSVAPLGQTR